MSKYASYEIEKLTGYKHSFNIFAIIVGQQYDEVHIFIKTNTSYTFATSVLKRFYLLLHLHIAQLPFLNVVYTNERRDWIILNHFSVNFTAKCLFLLLHNL